MNDKAPKPPSTRQAPGELAAEIYRTASKLMERLGYREELVRIAKLADAIDSFEVPGFVECDSCRAKLGSPTLCSGCLHNRTQMQRLVDKRDRGLGWMENWLITRRENTTIECTRHVLEDALDYLRTLKGHTP